MFFEVTFPTLAPVCLMILLGWGLHRSKRLPEDFFSGLNKLTFYIGLPAILLVGIATSPFEAGPAFQVLYVLIATTVSITLLAYVCARLLRLPPPTTASFVQIAMRGNLAYIGLPVLFYALDSLPPDMDPASFKTAAMLVLAPSVPLYNIACVTILAHGANRGAGHHPSKREIAQKIITNPLIIACLAGLFLSTTGMGLPKTLERTLRPLGDMALPLALFSIGASFTQGKMRATFGRAAWAASLLKVAIMPLIGVLFIRLFGVGNMEARMALIFLACPTAISGYVMAEQMGADDKLAGSGVLLSTILAMLALAVVLSIP
ncbi:MAG: AEC family transporter [Kiritimatiellia bacterium]